MANRGSVLNLLLSLVAFLVFMVILLAALGFGMGAPELLVWLVVLIVGVVLIVRTHRSATAGMAQGERSR